MRTDTDITEHDFTPASVSHELHRYARSGEQEFASIHRNRSGIDAGNIDYGWSPFWCQENLSDGDKQELVDTCFALYKSMSSYFGVTAHSDSE